MKLTRLEVLTLGRLLKESLYLFLVKQSNCIDYFMVFHHHHIGVP